MVPGTPATPGGGSADGRRMRRLAGELALRAGLAVVILLFDLGYSTVTAAEARWLVRATTVGALLLNVPYYLAARTGWRLRAQAYARMLGDVGLITLGLYTAGGLAAAPFLTVYAIVPLYVGLVFSSTACLVATGAATLAYVTLGLLQEAGWLAEPEPLPRSAWAIAAFNLLMVNAVGGLTALLAEAYRRSRLRLAEVNRELERSHDASLKLNAEIQRAAQLRTLGEAVAGVVHELGNALTVAVGNLKLVRRESDRTPEIKRYLDRVESGLDAALRIVHNALQTSRRSGRPAPVSLPDVARRVVELKSYDLRRAGVTARLAFPDAFPPIHAVAFQLQQVLLNLVGNAQQAMAQSLPPREIAIAGRVEGPDVIVEVADTGPGIAEDTLPRLFEPFFTTKEEGTGLGLPVSAGIVRELGGELTARNREGGGAVFRIRLPVAPVAEPPR
jgi:signal transduction histidine kinase